MQVCDEIDSIKSIAPSLPVSVPSSASFSFYCSWHLDHLYGFAKLELGVVCYVYRPFYFSVHPIKRMRGRTPREHYRTTFALSDTM